MSLVELFGTQIKPRLTRGKKMWCPLPTGRLTDDILCIRDRDVNCFLLRGEHGYMAIDSGYKNSEWMREGLKRLGIDPQGVHTVFLTHLDIDHAGGVDKNCTPVFPKASLWLSTEEGKYLTGAYCRKRVGPVKCALPIALRDYRRFEAGRAYEIDGVSIEPIPVPGHTLGHTAFLVDHKYLFSGDSIISDGSQGWRFYDFWSADSGLNRQSLKELKAFAEARGVEMVITSHSGALPAKAAFARIGESPHWRRRGFIFRPDAPEDPYTT